MGLQVVQLLLVNRTDVLLALPRPWVSREGGLERASQGKGKRNVARRGWVEICIKKWGETRGKYC